MTRFSDIIGNSDIISTLENAVASGRTPHAWILQGDTGCGKKSLAAAFAAALLCENGGADSCGKCESCLKVGAGSHPDLKVISHEKPSVITVDEVRKNLASDVMIKPYLGSRKIYIIPEAEKMNTPAQNALLKTLEEPPEYAVMILLTVNAGALLETVRSRCILLDIKPLTDDQVCSYLMENAHLPDYRARIISAFSRGSIGRGLELASSEEFEKIISLAVKTSLKLHEMDEIQISAMVRELAEIKQDINDYFELLTMWHRDVLYFKATMDAAGLIFKDRLKNIRKKASESSYEGLEIILDSIEKARTRLAANVSFDLTMELLLYTIREN